GTLVGTLDSIEADVGNTFTFTLLSPATTPDNAAFSINAAGELLTAESFNFEVKNVYTLLIRATDQDGLSVDEQVIVQILDQNDPPNTPALSLGNEVITGDPAGTPVGTFVTFDEDPGDSFTYTFATGFGDTDNALFTLSPAGDLATAT